MRLDKISIVAIVFGLLLLAFFSYRTRESAQMARAPSAIFAGVPLKIELATTETARELGLGGRASVPENYAMLFVFPDDGYYGFWMKDTLVPLDIFWLDAAGKVVSVAAEVATSTYPEVFYPSAPARLVLETAAGFASSHGVKRGSVLVLKNFGGVLK